jgi:O-antigen/teichoic acid export membrane protein
LNAYAENLSAYFQAIERMARWTQASALFGIVSAVVGVALLLTTGSLVAYCWGFVVGWAAALVWLAAGLPPEARSARGPLGADLRRLAAGVAPFAAAFVGLTVYCKVDVLLLERWSGAQQAGLYTAAYKFVDITQALVIVASGAVFPRLARTADGRHEGRWGAARSTEVVLLGVVPVALALHLVARPLAVLLFGPGYEASGDVLAWLALLLPLLAVSIHGGYVLAAAGHMLPAAGLYALGLGVNLGLNAALIPRLGAEGAALARLGSEALLVVGFTVALARVARATPGRRVLAAVGATTVACALALLVHDPTGGWLRAAGVLLVAVPIYGAARVISAADVGRLRGALFGRATRAVAEPRAG